MFRNEIESANNNIIIIVSGKCKSQNQYPLFDCFQPVWSGGLEELQNNLLFSQNYRAIVDRTLNLICWMRPGDFSFHHQWR